MKTILASPIKPGDHATAPVRVVLSRNNDGFRNTYATHLQNMKNEGKFWGHYFYNIGEAMDSYEKRCKKLGVSAMIQTAISA